MPIAMRAAQAALVFAVLACAPAAAQAPRQQGGQPGAAAGGTTALPPMRAQPPANRRPGTQAQPQAQGQRPASASTQTAARRQAPVQPAARVPADSTPGAAGPAPERWEAISVETANSGTYRLPVGRGHSGPSVLHVQVLLNRAFFSAGMIDGRWGRNTQGAVQWFQAREGLPATGTVDSATYARLRNVAGPEPTVREHVLTADEVKGPFVQIPSDIYQHARLTCSCYESLTEKLTETFASSAELLHRLNPGVNLDSVAAGTRLNVPALRDPDARPAGEVKQIVVSGTGNYLHALDAGGRILYHFAATLGSSYDPSPAGDFAVTSIHENPWWNYQPRLLAHVPDDRPNALIPPGPNSAVGRVWMSLSAPHYGIHGTKSPETIGYAQSAGCVRLTNWDVMFLSRRVTPGTPVAFRNTRDGAATTQQPPAGQRPAPAEARPQPSVLGVPADSARRDSAAAPPPPAATTPAQPQPAAPAPQPQAQPAPPPPADTTKAPRN
ncbi:MAG TPA: L,D-transpeptidase family protein [Longimicrobium sp.]|nr:L,D-transpeptidase family protein [Longimicrobium sp.]